MTGEQQERMFLITESELDAATVAMAEDDEDKCVLAFYNRIRSRPAPTAPKFNSTDLLLLAHDEWKRREERKHNHPEVPWCQGFINGFLTDKKWARELVDKMHKNAEQLRQSHQGGDRR